ncbi:glycosyltransferase family 39 protein [Candidatus Woesearchaeota archaeon]|nr:glycosyltransferase family 39 protein [Candidatus Woesearchaeota archaeon]
MKKTSHKAMPFLIFLIFLSIRIFVDFPAYFIGGDDAKYLTLAKHFPYHTLDNKGLFLLHGPMYPYLLHFFDLFFEDYMGGIILSLFSSIVAFFVLYKLILLLTKRPNMALGVVAFYALSVEHIRFATAIHKESFMTMLFLLSIYFYLKGLMANKKYFHFASFFGAVTALATDHVVFVIASFIVAYLIFRKKETKTLRAAIPIIIAILFYSTILLTRVYVYTHNEYYSTGVDGVIEKVSDFGIRQVFAPAFFPETMQIVFSKTSLLINILFIFAYLLNIAPFAVPAALNRHTIGTLFANPATSFFSIIKFIVYIVLFILFLLGIYALIKELLSKKTRNNHNLFLFAVFLLFFFPVTQRITTIRMVLTASIPLFYFIVLGYSKLRINNSLRKYLPVLTVIILILMPIYWISAHNHFVFSIGKFVEAGNTSIFLNSLPKDGIMAQVGYSPELNYQTSKRIISMPSGPENLNFILKNFGVNYVLHGERYWEKFSENNRNRVYNYDIIKHVKENPQKFKLIKAIEERNEELGYSDTIYVYEVI